MIKEFFNKVGEPTSSTCSHWNPKVHPHFLDLLLLYSSQIKPAHLTMHWESESNETMSHPCDSLWFLWDKIFYWQHQKDKIPINKIEIKKDEMKEKFKKITVKYTFILRDLVLS